MNTTEMLPASAPSQVARMRKYIILAMILVHILVFAVCTGTGYPESESIVQFVAGLILSCFAVCSTILYARTGVPAILAMFILFTFTVKLPFCILNPEKAFLIPIPLDDKDLGVFIYERFFYFSIGFAMFAVGAIFASRFVGRIVDAWARTSEAPAPRKGLLLVMAVCVVIQAMRAFLLLVLQIGAPGVASGELFLPNLAGFLDIVGKVGLLVFVSGLLAWAFSRRSFLTLGVAVMAAIALIGVEMAGGWRLGLFRYSVCGAWIFLAFGQSKLRNKLVPFAVALGLLVVFAFGPVMVYRHHLRKGLTSSQAIRATLEAHGDDEGILSSSLFGIARRFSGIDKYIVVSHAMGGTRLGYMSLIDGRVARYFTNEIAGVPDHVVTTIGYTNWGVWVVAMGDRWIWLSGLSLGMLVGALPALGRRWFYSPTMQTVFESNATIIMFRVAMGNGAYTLYAKEFLILFVACFVFRAITETSEYRATFSQRRGYSPGL